VADPVVVRHRSPSVGSSRRKRGRHSRSYSRSRSSDRDRRYRKRHRLSRHRRNRHRRYSSESDSVGSSRSRSRSPPRRHERSTAVSGRKQSTVPAPSAQFVTVDAFKEAIASLNSSIMAIGKQPTLTASQPDKRVPGPVHTPAPPLPSSAPILIETGDVSLDYDDDPEEVLNLLPDDEDFREFDTPVGAQTGSPVKRTTSAPAINPHPNEPPPFLHRGGDSAEQDAWSYHELIDMVYELLPRKHCPPQPPPEMKVRSVMEDIVGETVHQIPCLPHSSTVQATASLLSETENFVSGKKGFTVPAAAMRKLSVPGAYNVHSAKWPVKPPALDADASKVGIRSTPNVNASWQFVESVESKLRTSVSTLSHADLFCAAAHLALVQGKEQDCVSSLIQAAAKSARHAMGSTMAMSTELLMLRRDAAIAASNILPGENRERLRAAPLTADKLFGGLCASVATDDAAQRQRNQLVRPSTNFRAPAPKGHSRPNPSKGKGPRMSRVPPQNTRVPSPLNNNLETGNSNTFFRGRGRSRGASSRGRFSQNKPRRGSH